MSCLTRIGRARVSDRGPYLVAEETVAGPTVRAETEPETADLDWIALQILQLKDVPGYASICNGWACIIDANIGLKPPAEPKLLYFCIVSIVRLYSLPCSAHGTGELWAGHFTPLTQYFTIFHNVSQYATKSRGLVGCLSADNYAMSPLL